MRWMMSTVCAGLLAAAAPALALDEDEAIGFERTPPRLAFTDGEVSFLRPGAEEWTPAKVNTALAAGDELYAAEAANLELQVGARAYVRAGENTQLGLTSLEPDFLQLRVASGHASLDLRSLKAGRTIELDTPNGAFTVERTGYYRVEVDGDSTTFTSRRGGRATLTPAVGQSLTIAASEQVVVTGNEAPQIESYAAPELDAWDRWNYARTDEQLDAVSARYVPPDVYGADDLDHYGDWRVVPTYGPIWVPRRVAVGWAPYSTGRWLYDPYYGWTWVDDAPWGWAPYHYGRWVRVSGYWGWAPGPIVARPYYAPALVAFFGGGGLSIGVTIGTPYVGWVALGWGEPLVPWWGPTRFRAHPRWAGWGGPRIVNEVVVKRGTVIRPRDINRYRNARERDAFVTVERDHFGRREGAKASYRRGKPDSFRPLHDENFARPDRSSLVAERGAGKRPPQEVWKRSVVATRQPHRDPMPEFEARRSGSKPKPGSSSAERGAREAAPDATPAVRVVQPRREGKRIEAADRAPFGKRGESERAMPPLKPRFERARRSEGERPATRATEARPQRETAPAPPVTREATRSATPRTERPQAAPPERKATRPQATPPERNATRSQATPPERNATRPQAAPPERAERTRPERREKTAAPTPELPGEPANRVFQRRRPEVQQRPQATPREPEAREQEAGRAREARPARGSGGNAGSGAKQSRGRGGRN